MREAGIRRGFPSSGTAQTEFTESRCQVHGDSRGGSIVSGLGTVGGGYFGVVGRWFGGSSSKIALDQAGFLGYLS
ncbi:hypothetical protein HYQ46_002105 [Verticillium longisporum]|nr:hypothetical protein HYQ46_002105 [Verticillium longisporum]